MAFNTLKLHSGGQTYIFEDVDYVQGSIQDTLASSLIGTSLSIDEMTFTIRSRDSRKGNVPEDWLYDENDVQLFDVNDVPLTVPELSYAGVDFLGVTPYRDTVELWRDSTLEGFYYIQSVERIGHGGGWTFVGVSDMGIIDRQEHPGGVYFNVTAGTIIADLMGKLPYSIDPGLASTTMYGWLPYSESARQNLMQVLFACGASFMRDANFQPYFTYDLPTTLITKGIHEVYAGSSRDKLIPATSVQLTEHTFYASSNVSPDVLYEAAPGTVVTDYRITFDKPYHTLLASGLTISDSGANYAVISGTGSLTGIPYVHISRIMSKNTGWGGEQTVIAVKDATLISQMNSLNSLDRLADFYGQAEEISAEVLTDARPGEMLRIPDPNDFSKTVRGFIKSAARTYSGTVKSALKLTQNWSPGGVGNAYDSYVIITGEDLSGSSWSVPAELRGKAALVVLFGGAQGGQGGYDGERGGNGHSVSETTRSRGYGGEGGEGGAAGQGGGPGRFLTVNITSLANSYTVTLGAGGAGGAHGGTLGVLGGDTVLGSYSTASGSVLDGAYVNMIDGSTYGEAGDEGHAGMDGGKGGDLLTTGKKGEDGLKGEDYNTIWKGGSGGLGVRRGTLTASGGGGGGAAYGASGPNGGTSTETTNYGAPGANAIAPVQADFYRGGNGGNGGGGGGGSSYSWNELQYIYNHPGDGGLGSAGGQGADGFLLVYYKA